MGQRRQSRGNAGASATTRTGSQRQPEANTATVLMRMVATVAREGVSVDALAASAKSKGAHETKPRLHAGICRGTSSGIVLLYVSFVWLLALESQCVSFPA